MFYSTAVTGIKPTGRLHLGNYMGAITPILEDTSDNVLVFVADLHALNTHPSPQNLNENVNIMTRTLLACLPEHVHVYRQSRISAIPYLSVLLENFTSKGLLNRSHAYKSRVDLNRANGQSDDSGVNAGLFCYPVLMAADVLGVSASTVPVGFDQTQHVQVICDIAASVNRHCQQQVFALPKTKVLSEVLLPGIDGRKMSKSYGNDIELFADKNSQYKAIKKITTDSRSQHESKDPDSCTVMQLIDVFGQPETAAAMRVRYLEGNIGYGEAKDVLYEELQIFLRPLRERFIAFEDAEIQRRLAHSEQYVSEKASKQLSALQEALGI